MIFLRVLLFVEWMLWVVNRNIPHDEGLESKREAMHEYNRNLGLEKRVLVDELVDLAKLILENNYFEFEDKIYHQKLGTAIGKGKFVRIFRLC